MSASSFDRIAGYYDRFDEWSRLDTPAGRLELFAALRVLATHLAPGSAVLDVGGGPGRYAIELARRGHTVSLIDLAPALVETARRRIAEHGVEDRVPLVATGNVVDLARFDDAAFDAVVCFGPFYHLVERTDRERAMAEVTRVLRPGGLLFAAFVPRQSGVGGLLRRLAEHPEQFSKGTLVRAFMHGTFRNRDTAGFQEGWYPYVDEAERLFASTGLTTLELRSLRGLAYGHEDVVWPLADTDPDRFAQVVEILEATSGTDEVLATCGHALFVGRRG